ncbi:MAG: FtsX-like permease family protein [Actinomycetota bacterium]
MAVVEALALAALRHRPGRWVLLAVGIALTVAVPVVSSGTGRVVAAQTVRSTIADLDPGDRGILVTQLPNSVYRKGNDVQADATVRHELGKLTSAPVRREMVFRQLSLDGSTFFLGATDGLPGAVRLVDGRLPTSCTPARCEVVLLGAGDERTLTTAVASLGVVVVGRAVRTDPRLVSGKFDTGRVPLLIGDGVDQMAQLSPLQLFGRTYAWTAALDVERVIALGVPGYVQRGADVADTLDRGVGGVEVYRPDVELLEQNRRASLSARRFGLLGGSAAVLLLGFAVVAAVGLRREHALLVAVLRRRGATLRQIGILTAVETAATCALGLLLGVLLAGAVTAWLAHGARLPLAATAGHALLGAAPGGLLLVLAAAAVTGGVLLWPDTRSRTIWQSLDLLALCCLGAVILAADRGAASASGLEGGTDPLVIALPVLSAVVAGLVAARLWGPLARLAERALPRRSVAGRIALLGSIRRPLRAVTTTAFLTAAVASVVFAGAYRATLLAGAADQAAYQVPLDATVTPSRDEPTVAVAASSVAGVRSYGAVRTSATLQSLDGSTRSVPVLGVDIGALDHIHRWSRTTGSSRSAASLADDLRGSTASAVPSLPAGTRTVSIDAIGISRDIVVALWLRSDSGQEAATQLVASGRRLQGTLPTLGPGAIQAVGVVVQEEPGYATRHQHATSEGNTDQPVLAGKLGLGAVLADGAPVRWDWSTWGSTLGQVTASSGRLDLGYRMKGSQVVVTPAFVAAASLAALPVAVDPATAREARDGQLTLRVADQPVAARVVATLDRMPTIDGTVVLADRQALARLLNRTHPGAAAPTELWISAEGPTALGQALAISPYDRLNVTMRDTLQRKLEADPVGRGSRLLLAVVGVLALLVAAASLVLLVFGERRDGAGEFFAWESDGLPPSMLRRLLLVRTLAVVAIGVPIGLLAGVVLARVGATVVAVDASGTTPNPPLQVTLGSTWTLLVLVAGLGAGIAAGWLVVSRSLRERLPVRPEADLR